MGHDSERFLGKINDDLKCMICLDVLEDPYECTKCQTSFCLACINDWSAKKNTCPNNCELVLQRSHKFLRSELSKLQLTCVNREEGCGVVVTLESMDSHEALCEFARVKCGFNGCSVVVIRVQMKEHESVCEYREVLCENCNSYFYLNKQNEHSCVRVLAERISAIDMKVHRFVDECYFHNHLFNDSVNIHFGTKCKTCGVNPITGQRFFCKLCKDFSQCWKCNNEKKHEHKDFVEFQKNGVHENILCDECGMYPIGNLRYKCLDCSDFDLCHSCRLTTSHPHSNFKCLKPINITVKVLPHAKTAYRRGEELIRSWSIFNEGQEDFTDFSIACINGDCCSKEYVANSPYYRFNDIVVRAKQHREIFIKDMVTQNNTGYYKSQWAFEIPQRIGLFGPFLYYDLFVL